MISTFLRRFLFQYPAIIIVIAFFWGTLAALIDGIFLNQTFASPRVAIDALVAIVAMYRLFCIAALGGAIILLFRRKVLHALCYFIAAYTIPLSMFASAALRQDRFVFTSLPHREIARIYNEQKIKSRSNESRPLLIGLDETCHPPGGCECWVVLDPSRTSGVEKEVGGWHRPTAAIFPIDTFPRHFAIVDVRRLDPDDYSVLGCSADWRALVPL